MKHAKAFKSIAACALAATLFVSCAGAGGGAQKAQKVVVGASPEHYRRLGLNENKVEIQEDGTNTKGADGTYEWWYFDAYMEDGSSLVVTFYTRSMMNPDAPLAPFVSLEWNGADGTEVSERVDVPAEDFYASEERCDVRIGDAYIRGDLEEYDVYFSKGDLEVTAHLSANVPSWRQDTGYRFYGDGEEYYAAWLCVVPDGDVTATVTVAGETKSYTGSGYHDHNWGNHPLWQMQNDWYWGRAKAGPYVMVTSYITTAEAYGFKPFTTFLLAKDGEIIADDPGKVTFTAADEAIDPATGIPIADTLAYHFTDGDTQYQIEYRRDDTILAASMQGALAEAQREQAEAAGNRLMYYRFIGAATIEEIVNGRVADTQTAPSAIWELMYPGTPDKE